MTNKELQEKLKQFPDDVTVCIPEFSDYGTSAEEVKEVETIYRESEGPYGVRDFTHRKIEHTEKCILIKDY